MAFIAITIKLLSILTLWSIGFIIVLLILKTINLVSKKETYIFLKIKYLIQKNALLLSLIVSFTATFGSLFYSEIAGFEPCKLCWFQRIFMYPQLIIFAIALFKKDEKIFAYSLALSIIGVSISSYHYFLQFGFIDISCHVVGMSTLCTEYFKQDFGFITIPLEALTSFMFLIIFMYFLKNKEEQKIKYNHPYR